MKLRFMAAYLAATSIALFSCHWFSTKKKEPSNPVIGQWQLDSLSTAKDTSFAFALAFWGMADSNGVNFDFRKDTVITTSGADADTAFYRWDEKKQQVVTNDSSQTAFQFFRVTDSLITLTTTDSTIIYLTRK